MRTDFNFGSSAVALIASLISMGAAAQEVEGNEVQSAEQQIHGGATPSDELESVITVTAQRRAENLQDVPIAVSAFTSEQLVRSGVTNVAELTKLTPSLLVTEGSGPAQPYIRGVGGRYNTPGNEASTSLYVDGVYMPDKIGMLIQSFPDVESVQVLRGPQGTLFGRNATAGAILITTKKPDLDLGGMLEGTYGTHTEGARGFVTTGLSSTFAASVSGFYSNDRPYLLNGNPSNGGGKYVGGDRSHGGRLQLYWEPSANLDAMLSGYFTEGRANAGVALQPVPGGPLTQGDAVSLPLGIDIRNPKRAYYGEIDPQTRFKGYGSSLAVEGDMGAVAIRSITAYNHSTAGSHYDLDASPGSLFFFDTGIDSESFQQELVASSETSSPFQWIVGAFYLDFRDGFEQLDQFVGLPVPQPLEPRTVPASLYAASAAGRGPTSGLAYVDHQAFVDIHSLGLFGEGSYQFNDAAKLTLGLRYTRESHKLDEQSRTTTYVPNGAGGVIAIPRDSLTVCEATSSCDDLKTPFSELTYRAVFDYTFTPDLMAYVSYNRGFKSGVYNLSNAANVIATTPEILDSFELGFKSSLFDRLLTLNAAAYYYKYDNLQVTIVDPATNTQKSINAAAATISGLEVEAALRPSDRITLYAGLSTFFKAEYDSFENCVLYRPTGTARGGLAVAPGADCSGTRLPATPDIQFSLQANYNLPLNNGASVDFNGFFGHISEFNHNTRGFYPAGVSGGIAYPAGEGRAPDQKAINTVNAAITFNAPDDVYFVTIWGKNLLDQDNIFRNVSQTGFGYYTAFARGASAGVTIGTKFGLERN